jgi:type II secretory pathway pseudopilin PulG
MKGVFRFVLVMMAVAALAVTSLGQDAKDAQTVLSQAAKAVGYANLKTIHYTGSGSSYIVGSGPVPAGGWPHTVMKSYVRDINLDTMTSRLQLIRTEGTPPVDKTLTREANANSQWSSQYEFWLTPYGFLKGAMANRATVESRTVGGSPYRVVTFTPPGGQTVTGYINEKDLIERVETKVGDKNEVPVEALYRDYADFNSRKFPTLITEKQAGELSMILIVKEVK